jgi:hypothetical protein
MLSYAGSERSARSVVSIVGGRFGESSAGPGTVPVPAPCFGCHWCAPAGLFVSSHSYPNRFSKKPLDLVASQHVCPRSVVDLRLPLAGSRQPQARFTPSALYAARASCAVPGSILAIGA